MACGTETWLAGDSEIGSRTKIAEATAARLEYATLEAAVDELELGVDASEFHGAICGLLCAAGPGAVEQWLAAGKFDESPPSASIAEAALDTLGDVEAMSWQTLCAEDFPFEPLLPAGERASSDRVAALAAWCNGFLSGLGLGGDPLARRARSHEGTPLAEILSDFTEISRATLGAEDLEDATRADFDFAELVEYVRVGVQLAFEQLEPCRSSSPESSAAATEFRD